MILFSVAITVTAQFRVLKSIDEIEIAGGPSLVSLYNENITNDIRKPKIGFTVRVGLLYTLSERFSLNTSFLYERKGLKTRYEVWYYDPSIDSTNCQCTTSLGTKENNSNIDYLTLSTIVNFLPEKTNFYVGAGPFLSYLFKIKSYSKNLWDNSISYSGDNDSLKDIDLGISLSLGYKLALKENVFLNFQAMNNYGLLNIGNTSVTKTKTSTNSFSIQLGINYKLQ